MDSHIIYTIAVPLLVVFISFVIFLATKRYLLPLMHSVICAKNAIWHPIFDKHQPFRQLSYLTPIIFIYCSVQYIPDFTHDINRILNFYIAINLTLLLNGVISTFIEIYNLYPIAKDRPIKSYAQMLGMLIYIVGGVIAVCKLVDKDPWVFISGIGALTAVILLVFRDTILSFIAGIQILSNNLIRKDDWIEVPAFGANGAVIDVALHVIKVQNWDKTVVTIPTYKVIESGFKNWRGMYDAGGRRIKRSVLINQRSIRFMTQDDWDILNSNYHVKKYMQDLREDYQETSGKGGTDSVDQVNLGVFRRYVERYLQNHEGVNQDLTLIVRLLEPAPTGIPLEIYTFTKDTAWVQHEKVQSEIFEHLIAVMPVFGLYLYQQAAGHDLDKIHKAFLLPSQQKKAS